MYRSCAAAASLLFALVACGGDAAQPPPSPTTTSTPSVPPTAASSLLVTFETPEGSFKAVVDDPPSVERVLEAAEADGRAGIPNGRIVRGEGVNTGHEWHLEDVELVDVTVEVCDGTAEYVDEHLEDYLDIGRYCPWDATVVDVEPYQP